MISLHKRLQVAKTFTLVLLVSSHVECKIDASDEELESLSAELFTLEGANNAAKFISLNPSSSPFLSVAPQAFSLPTIEKLLALHDNYIAETALPELDSPREAAEREAFVDAIFATPVMIRAQEFLASKNETGGSSQFHEMWFGLYSRDSSGALGSSGFEHCFLHEIKEGRATGIGHWIHFYDEEQAGRVKNGQLFDLVELNSKGHAVELTYEYEDSGRRPISGLFIGISPELELALYTVCWHARPNGKCPVRLPNNGEKVKVQTYTIGSQSQFVASAYVDLSD